MPRYAKRKPGVVDVRRATVAERLQKRPMKPLPQLPIITEPLPQQLLHRYMKKRSIIP